jgi:hypothetical protein
MECPICAQDNAPGEKICNQCKLPLPTEALHRAEAGIICSNCQYVNAIGSFFCYNCGLYFREESDKAKGTGTQNSSIESPPPDRQSAKILIPGREDIKLSGSPVFIERTSFDPTLPQDVLMSISRQHVLISFDRGTYYIQDYGRDGTGSTNHTRLNNVDIHGKGKQPLNDGDHIELAHQKELPLVFKLT